MIAPATLSGYHCPSTISKNNKYFRNTKLQTHCYKQQSQYTHSTRVATFHWDNEKYKYFLAIELWDILKSVYIFSETNVILFLIILRQSFAPNGRNHTSSRGTLKLRKTQSQSRHKTPMKTAREDFQRGDLVCPWWAESSRSSLHHLTISLYPHKHF